MDIEEAAALEPLQELEVSRRWPQAVLLGLCTCLACLSLWLLTAIQHLHLHHGALSRIWSPRAVVPAVGRTPVLRLPAVTTEAAQQELTATETWNIIEYCEKLTVPQLRQYLFDRGLFGHSRANRTLCMQFLRRFEGEEKWAEYEADLRRRQQPELFSDGGLIEYCNSLSIMQLRAYLASRGITGCSRLSRTAMMATLRRLEGEDKWAEHETVFAAKQQAQLAADEAEDEGEEESATLPEYIPDEADLQRRQAYYSTLNVKQLRRLLSTRKETMYSNLTRDGCLERLRQGDKVGKGKQETLPDPSPPPGGKIREQLEMLTIRELRQVANRAGLESYGKLNKPDLIELMMVYLDDD